MMGCRWQPALPVQYPEPVAVTAAAAAAEEQCMPAEGIEAWLG